MSSNANLSFIDTCWFSLEIVGFHWVFVKLTMKKPSLVMMRECPCSTKTREGLQNPSPPPSRFPLAMVFAPLDLRDIPRVSGCKTHGRGKSLKISLDPRDGSREILGVGDGFSNPSLLLVEHGYNMRIFRGKDKKGLHTCNPCSCMEHQQLGVYPHMSSDNRHGTS